MLAARGFQLLALIALLFIAALLLPELAWAAVMLDAALLAAALWDWRQARAWPLGAQRRLPPLLVQGVPAIVEVRFASGGSQSRGGRPDRRPDRMPGRSQGARLVRLRDGLHPGVAVAPRHHELLVGGGAPAALPVSMALPALAALPAVDAVWSYEIVPRRRGEHGLGPLSARVLGPWGLAWAQRQLLAGERVRVYPQVRWEGRVGQLLSAAQRQRLGQLFTPLQGAGSEPYALRSYLPGDPLGKIHWKATARHGRLVSREDTWERSSRLVILLDCARTMTGAEDAKSKQDYALAAALALARFAAARGDQVSLIAFSDRIDRTVRVRSGARAIRQAYAALYDLQARLAEPAYDLAVEAASRLESRRATVALLTSVTDLAAADLLRESLLRLAVRHRPLVLNLEDPDVRRLAIDPPATPEEAFAQVAALEILLANRRLATHLRRGGIQVINTPADQLALRTLESYLSVLKGRSAGFIAAAG